MRSIPVFSVFLFSLIAVRAQLPGKEAVIIPVVVHVLYNTPAQNISNEQVVSQITALNKDYRKKNRDSSNIPAHFRPYAADSRIEFRLATIDPAGLPTNGIIRKSTTVASFGKNDQMKSALSGGSDGWNRDQYLNIWVCNLSDGIMGFASTPGCEPASDGVVIRHSVFGTTANVKAPYHRGRTTVHEVGHWLGLKHIWGDRDCGDDDVDDTPPQQGPTRGCPSGVVTGCTSKTGGTMYMNFMDFTNDDCLSMFTHGQVARMHELFAPGSARHALLYSDKAAGAAITEEAAIGQGWQAYPNPVKDVLNITMGDAGKSGPEVIVIYNQTGQVMRTLLLNNRTMSVAVGNWPKGLYYISVGSKKVLRFVKNG